MPNVAYTPSAATRIVRRATNSAAKTDSTLANDDTLLWAVAANEVWHFQVWLLLSAANNTHDVKYGWSVPAGTTMFWGSVGTVTALNGFGQTSSAGAPLVIGTEAGTVAAATAAGTFGQLYAGIVRVSSTAGTVNLQWAQNTTDAGSLILLADSFLQLARLA